VAITRYLEEALTARRRPKHRKASEEAQIQQDNQERTQAIEKGKEVASLKIFWEALDEGKREEIRQAVLHHQPASFQNFLGLIERFCLEELARHQGASISERMA
jgi:hypothetical protein